MDKQAYLILQNGMAFAGAHFGAEGEIAGEVVFTTGMTGYLEALTDPSYHGQILVQTFPLIGNYGVIPEDFESQGPKVRAYIVRECCQAPSNFRCQGTLEAYLKEQKVIGLCGVDTRALTRAIRENGVMNGIITDSKTLTPAQQALLDSYEIRGAVQAVTTPEVRQYEAEGEQKHRVALWDFGTKRSLIQALRQRGCQVTVWPAGSTAAEILADEPEGIVLSEGPGDPAENAALIEQIAQLCQAKRPVLGVGLGHELLALSQGAKTYRIKHGHRGANQPVKDLATGRVCATSQNHGYAVDSESVQAPARVCRVNVNDGTCAGIAYEGWGDSVQFAATKDVLDAWMAKIEGGNGHAAF